MKKNYLSLVFKLLILITCGIGLYLNFKFISLKNGIVYFTLQSNILCFIFYAILIVYLLYKNNYKKDNPKNDKYYIYKGLISANITLTMIIYTILELTNSVSAYEGHLIECLFVHYFTPIFILLDYIVFDEKGNFKWYYPFLWSIIPFMYMIFNLIYTISGGKFVEGKYAYEFLNVDRFGISGVVINCGLIYIFFMLINYIVLYVDKKVGEKQ